MDAGDAAAVAELVTQGASVRSVDGEGNTALMLASMKGHAQIAETLLNKGADVNAENEDRWTSLHSAAFFGHLDVARLLLDSGANANASRHMTAMRPYDMAAGQGRDSVAALIRERGGISRWDTREPIDIGRLMPSVPSRDKE